MPITQDLFTITPSPRIRTITKINAVPRIRDRIRTAGYARVSTAADNQEGSLIWQKTHLEQIICSNPDYEYAGMYEDDGISGTEAETRPGLQQLIADCRAGLIQRVICKSISRMARNVTDLLEIIHTFNDLGVTVFFEKERQDTGTMGSEFLLSILGTFAAQESKSISDNLKWAWRRKFAKGEAALPCAPYGYDREAGTLVINEAEAEIVREIYSRVIKGEGTIVIANDLNSRGVPTKRGGMWSSVTVGSILRNITYTGSMLLQKTYAEEFKTRVNRGELDQFFVTEHHEAIIPQEVYDRVQSIEALRRAEHNVFRLEEDEDNALFRNQRSCFSSHLFCHTCGAVLHRALRAGSTNDADPVTGKSWGWICSQHRKDITKCAMKPVRETDIQNAFINMVNKLVYSETTDYPIVSIFIEGIWGEERERNAATLRALGDEMDKIVYERQSAAELAQRSAIAPATYRQKLHQLNAREMELKQQQTRLAKSHAVKEAEKLKAMLPREQITVFDEVLFGGIVECVEIQSREFITFELKCGLRLTEWFQLSPFAPSVSTTSAPAASALFPPTTT